MMFDSNHSPDWVPNMDGPFAEELAAYIRHKHTLDYQYAEPVCYTLKKMDRPFRGENCRQIATGIYLATLPGGSARASRTCTCPNCRARKRFPDLSMPRCV